MTSQITYTTDSRGVLTVRLNAPEKHNAFNAEMIAELTQVFSVDAVQPAVRALVLEAEGKSFCAGADLGWMKESASWTKHENEEDALRLARMLDALDKLPIPTIAAVQGPAFGGGVGLVACCDMAVASEDAAFSLSEVRLGLIPATISPYVLAKIGVSAARRLFLTAERFSAEVAAGIGLVHEVTTPGMLMARAEGLADATLKMGPHALAGAKALIRDVAGQPVDGDLMIETAKRIAHHRTSTEGQEGLAAFFERRPPNWVQVRPNLDEDMT